VQLVGAQQIRSRGSLSLAGVEGKITRVVGRNGGFGDTCRRYGRGIFCRGKIATRCLRCVEELCLLCLERRSSRDDLRPFPLTALPVEIGAVQLLAELPQCPLSVLDIGARHAERGSNFLLVPRVRAQLVIRGGERGFELRQIARRALELGAYASRYRISLASLLFRALAPRSRIAQPFFGDCNLAAQLLCALALIGDESTQLGPSGFRGRASGEGGIAR